MQSPPPQRRAPADDAVRSRLWPAALVAAAAIVAVAGLGMLATDLGPWYRGLEQPPWKPPDAAFGPAWTLIYILTGIAAVRVWQRASSRAARRRWLAALALNGMLQVAWSAIFFKARRPDWALAEVAMLWLSIAALIVLARSIDAPSAWLLAPYLAWVSFAAALNGAVVMLNGPFA
jgi:translocator protein